MDWRDRFRAPAVTSAQVARENEGRGVVITDIDDKFQAYAWDRREGSLRQVTDAKSAVISTAISHDGQWIYAIVETEAGTEIGHVHRFSFDGSWSEDITPDLPYYSSFGFTPTAEGLLIVAGLEGRQSVLVVDEEGVRALPMPSLVLRVLPAQGNGAVVTMTTPGRGMVPMTQVVDTVSGAVLAEARDASVGATNGARIAVGFIEGDWVRPGIWQEGEVSPIEVDIEGDVTPTDWSADGSTILLSQSHRSKSALYLYEVGAGEIVPLASPPGGTYPMSLAKLIDSRRAISVWSDANNPWRVFESTPQHYALALDLTEQRSFPGPLWEEFTVPSPEGHEIQSWLLRPEGEGPWPTVVYTHGGPTSVAGPMFSPLAGAWFDAGFAVASINYRGSTTFGESFRESLTGNLGGPEVADVVAATRWLVDNGVARPDAIVKNGYSYGGYLTLQLLGTHPDLWAAGVAGAPIADWRMTYEDSNDVLKGYFVSIWGGTPDQLGAVMDNASPRTYVSEYQAPLLISQPEGDSRTPMRPVQRFVDEMRDNGKDVDLRILAGGHAGSGIGQTIEMMESWLEFATRVVGLV